MAPLVGYICWSPPLPRKAVAFLSGKPNRRRRRRRRQNQSPKRHFRRRRLFFVFVFSRSSSSSSRAKRSSSSDDDDYDFLNGIPRDISDVSKTKRRLRRDCCYLVSRQRRFLSFFPEARQHQNGKTRRLSLSRARAFFFALVGLVGLGRSRFAEEALVVVVVLDDV